MSEAKAHEPAGLGRRLAAMLYDGLLAAGDLDCYGADLVSYQWRRCFRTATDHGANARDIRVLRLLLASPRRDTGHARLAHSLGRCFRTTASWWQIALRLCSGCISLGCLASATCGSIWARPVKPGTT